MPIFKVNVKWGKEKFEAVECNTDEVPIVFKAQLFALSGVQPERQKVMVKGQVIKDDDWGATKSKLKDNATLLMMGTADELPQAPTEKVVFLEDMSEAELATALEMPAGLTNLGNTCYMNATLQCLRSVPELKTALTKYPNTGSGLPGMNPDQSITSAIQQLYSSMDQTAEAFPPILMLNVLHICYPQFAEKDEHGHLSQQDANECWTELVRCLQKRLPALKDAPSELEGAAAAAAGPSQKSFVDQYMGGEYDISMKCIEAESEPETKSTEPFYQLSCFIDKEVKYIHTGLKNRLEEHITKNSPSLGRDAQYSKKQRINRLPAYLTIQMVRFFYKEKEGVNAKILKDIKFPMVLDVFDLCTEDLQKKLVPMRDRMKEEDEKNVEIAKKKKLAGKKGEEDTRKLEKQPFSFPEDPGSNNSGYYELQAVLTHKGRSSSSGHYVAWVKKHKAINIEGNEYEWLMFDDDKVSPVQGEDILKLSGGGDWHCAYLLVYGPRVLEIDPNEPKTESNGTAQAESTEAGAAKKDTPMES